MDNAIIDNLSLVEDLYAAASTLAMNALDYHERKSGGYVDVRKDDFDYLARAVEFMKPFMVAKGDSGE
ncbi:hypothetical protein ES705_20565 [subsurface metagenome]